MGWMKMGRSGGGHKGQRVVRTPEGAKRYGVPIGTPLSAAKAKQAAAKAKPSGNKPTKIKASDVKTRQDKKNAKSLRKAQEARAKFAATGDKRSAAQIRKEHAKITKAHEKRLGRPLTFLEDEKLRKQIEWAARPTKDQHAKANGPKFTKSEPNTHSAKVGDHDVHIESMGRLGRMVTVKKGGKTVHQQVVHGLSLADTQKLATKWGQNPKAAKVRKKLGRATPGIAPKRK
jgi:hypothetical protein